MYVPLNILPENQILHSKSAELILERPKPDRGLSGFSSTIIQNNALAKSNYQRQKKPDVAITTSLGSAENQYSSQPLTLCLPSSSLQIPASSSTASALHRRSHSQGVPATTDIDFPLKPDTLSRRYSHLGSTAPQISSSAYSDSQVKAPQVNHSDPSIQRLDPSWHYTFAKSREGGCI